MTHVFQLTYSDKETVTISVSFEDDSLAIAVDPPTVKAHHRAEFDSWISDVFANDLLSVLPERYHHILAAYGLKVMKDKDPS